MKPDPKPIKVEKEKMTVAEFRKKYGTPLKRKSVKIRKNKASKKTERQKYIAAADQWFSRRVRLEAADEQGVGRCIDCGTPVDVKYADCGHFWSRRHLSTRWDIRNANLQKKKCNLEMGRPETNEGYRARLIEKIGMEEFEKLENKRLNTWKPTLFEIGIIIDENKARVSYLLHKKGLKAWW